MKTLPIENCRQNQWQNPEEGEKGTCLARLLGRGPWYLTTPVHDATKMLHMNSTRPRCRHPQHWWKINHKAWRRKPQIITKPNIILTTPSMIIEKVLNDKWRWKEIRPLHCTSSCFRSVSWPFRAMWMGKKSAINMIHPTARSTTLFPPHPGISSLVKVPSHGSIQCLKRNSFRRW